ncbi:MAG: hypothetical protein MUC62_05465 [Candidatus Thermoplasmatota archaeon]|jgi:hypothetical protein|nr:hypothetical protein [Candidatus Thermoplasmatota archaeon]
MGLPNGTNVTSPPTTSTISPTPKVFKPNERKTITIDLKTTDLYILYGNPEIPFSTWELGEYKINVLFTSYVCKSDSENEWFELNSEDIEFDITA